jgi:hypothetical protein
LKEPQLTPAPILRWTHHKPLTEIEAPAWWDAALEALFPLDGRGAASYACDEQQPGGAKLGGQDGDVLIPDPMRVGDEGLESATGERLR